MDICSFNTWARGRISAWTEREYPQSQLDTSEFLMKRSNSFNNKGCYSSFKEQHESNSFHRESGHIAVIPTKSIIIQYPKKRSPYPPIVKRYMDSIYKGFQIRNDFFRGNKGRILELKRAHFREMRQIYTTWDEPSGTNSIKLVCYRESMLLPNRTAKPGKNVRMLFYGHFFKNAHILKL